MYVQANSIDFHLQVQTTMTLNHYQVIYIQVSQSASSLFCDSLLSLFLCSPLLL